MKRILIPTDFTVGSLSVLKTVLSTNTHAEQYDVTLLHGMYANDSITELLFQPRYNRLDKMVNAEFREALMILKNKHQSSIRSIREDIFSGFNQRAFNNYIEANGIEEIFTQENYSFSPATKDSFNLMPFIVNCGVKVSGVGNTAVVSPEKGQIAEILFNAVAAQ